MSTAWESHGGGGDDSLDCVHRPVPEEPTFRSSLLLSPYSFVAVGIAWLQWLTLESYGVKRNSDGGSMNHRPKDEGGSKSGALPQRMQDSQRGVLSRQREMAMALGSSERNGPAKAAGQQNVNLVVLILTIHSWQEKVFVAHGGAYETGPLGTLPGLVGGGGGAAVSFLCMKGTHNGRTHCVGSPALILCMYALLPLATFPRFLKAHEMDL